MRQLILFLVVVGMVKPVPIPASPVPSARLAVILVDFPTSDPPQDYEPQRTRETMAQVDAFYLEQSYGQFVLTSDVFGIYKVPLDVNASKPDIAAAAQAAASAAGVDLSTYSHFLYVSPITNFVQGGFGGASGAWIALLWNEVRGPSFQMAAHELGHHLFNLNHAKGTVCADALYGGTQCTTHEYGDTLDVMGQGDGHFNPVTKEGLQWLTPTGIQRIVTVTDDGDYTILPYASQAGGIKALKVLGGFKKGNFNFFLTYKQPIGFDVYQEHADPANVFNGVLFHRFVIGGPQLLSHTQQTPYPFVITQPALLVGQSYCDINAKTSYEVLSANPSGLTIRIRFRQKC